MSYDELCKSLGIDREAITKACADPVSIAVGKEQRYFQNVIGPRVKSPPIEDVSRLVDEYGQEISKRLRKPPNTKPK
jgi:hypothetical protein